MDLNVCIFTGRLGRDPEMRFLETGDTAVTNFPLAVTLGRDKTLWLDVTVWGKQAVAVNEYMSKGRQVAVEGRLSEDEWEDESGARRRKMKLTANRVIFLSTGGGQQDREEREERQTPQPKQEAAPREPPPPPIVPSSTDFPF